MRTKPRSCDRGSTNASERMRTRSTDTTGSGAPARRRSRSPRPPRPRLRLRTIRRPAAVSRAAALALSGDQSAARRRRPPSERAPGPAPCRAAAPGAGGRGQETGAEVLTLRARRAKLHPVRSAVPRRGHAGGVNGALLPQRSICYLAYVNRHPGSRQEVYGVHAQS